MTADEVYEKLKNKPSFKIKSMDQQGRICRDISDLGFVWSETLQKFVYIPKEK